MSLLVIEFHSIDKSVEYPTPRVQHHVAGWALPYMHGSEMTLIACLRLQAADGPVVLGPISISVLAFAKHCLSQPEKSLHM